MRYRRLVLSLIIPAVLLASAAQATDWVMSRFGPDQSGFTTDKISLPLAVKWQYATTQYDYNTASPVVANGICYFASGSIFYAVDSNTGSLIWKYPKEKNLEGSIKGTPCVYNGNVYFGSGDRNIYCLSADKGEIKWFQATGGPVKCPPIITDSGALIVGSDDNTIQALDPETGKTLWQKPFVGSDDIASGIAVSVNIMVAACMDGNIYGINTNNGKVKWAYRLPSPSSDTSPVLAGDIAIVSYANTLLGLSARSGQIKWRMILPSEISATPAVNGNDFYVPCDNGKLYSYTLTQRDPVAKWLKPIDMKVKASAGPVITSDTIYVMGRSGVFCAYNLEDGELKFNYTLVDKTTDVDLSQCEVKSQPTLAGGSLYILPTSGVLHCLSSDAPDNEKPTLLGMYPNLEQPISGVPPITMSVTVYDTGSGINYNSVMMSLDGKPLITEIDYKKSLVSHKVKPATSGPQTRVLDPGKHTLSIHAKDNFGNEIAQDWEFNVDPSILPPAKNEEQGPQSKQQQQQQGRPGGFPGGGMGPGGGVRPGGFPGGGMGPGGGMEMPPPPPPGAGW